MSGCKYYVKQTCQSEEYHSMQTWQSEKHHGTRTCQNEEYHVKQSCPVKKFHVREKLRQIFFLLKPQLILQFYFTILVCFKGNYNFPRFHRGPIFPGGSPFFRGVQMLISIGTYILRYFPAGSGPPVPPLDPRMMLYNHVRVKYVLVIHTCQRVKYRVIKACQNEKYHVIYACQKE